MKVEPHVKDNTLDPRLQHVISDRKFIGLACRHFRMSMNYPQFSAGALMQNRYCKRRWSCTCDACFMMAKPQPSSSVTKHWFHGLISGMAKLVATTRVCNSSWKQQRQNRSHIPSMMIIANFFLVILSGSSHMRNQRRESLCQLFVGHCLCKMKCAWPPVGFFNS